MSAANIAEHFDRKAAGWDADERRHALAGDIVRAVEREIGNSARPKLLDYGAGTGLCSIALAPKCSSILAVDVSPEMLSRLNEKAQAAKISNLKTCLHDLRHGPIKESRFDVILCAMTMHHVQDTDILLQCFCSMLEPNGFLAIADLDKEDGSFHDDPTGVEHHGFCRDQLVGKMMNSGLTLVSMETVHQFEKTSSNGPRRYPVFFATGRKRVS